METKTYIIVLLVLVQLMNVITIIRNCMNKIVHKPVTIKLYYASWCGASRMFYSEWDRLVKLTESDYPSIKTEKIDCESNKGNIAICSAKRIEAYPTIMVIDRVTGNTKRYIGRRTAEDIIKFALI